MVKNVGSKKLWRIRIVGSLTKRTLANKDLRKFGEKNFGELKSMHVQYDTFLTLLIDSPTHGTVPC